MRRCDFTNYCEGLDQKHKQVTCQLWDREALDEPGVRLANDGAAPRRAGLAAAAGRGGVTADQACRLPSPTSTCPAITIFCISVAPS